jgi:uncharacterized protein
MLIHQEHKIPSSIHQKPITFDIRFEEGANHPLIIFLHGFKGFKDWGHFNLISSYLASNGFAVLKMNFSHNGTSPEALTDFVDLEAFGNNNFSKELQDVDDVLHHVHERFKEELDVDNIFLLGHSKGGATAIIKAAESDIISKTATLASIINIKERYAAGELDHWKREGVIYVPNARTNQQMPLFYQLAEDVLSNEERFDLEQTIKEYHKPLLMLHGAKDETVKLEEFMQVEQLNPEVESYLIPDTNHTFDGSHPYEEDALHIYTVEALDKVIEFFKA